MAHNLGHTVVIANPTAHSGRGAAAAEKTRRFFEAYRSMTTSFELLLTHAAGEATEMAADLAAADTVIALGGDGLIHEVVCGLMRIPQESRPRLAIIAMGSGNDFARTIGARLNQPEEALAQILNGTEQALDVGVIDAGTPGETYVVETLSFGLDAAIALDTTDRRAADTKQTGAGLFATSGVKIMSKAHTGWPYRARYVDAAGETHEIEGTEIIFALQMGPTYGGGFPITPDASPTDGLIDLCRNVRIPSVPVTLALFGMARFGRHTASKTVAFDRLTHLEIEFPEEVPPAQVDGEALLGSRHTVDVAPGVLHVIVPA